MRAKKKEWTCAMCGDVYGEEDLDELKEMNEEFVVLGDPEESDQMICPDCWDEWNRMSEDEKFEALMEEKA